MSLQQSAGLQAPTSSESSCSLRISIRREEEEKEVNMKLCLVFLFALQTVYVSAGGPYYDNPTYECGMWGQNVVSASGKKVPVKLPCKYHAVRQKCGKYFVNLTPGNIYLANKFRLDTLWMGLVRSDGQEWEGRTENKMAVKYFNGQKTDLFNKKNADGIATSNVLKFGKMDKTTYAEEVDGEFRVTFAPWEPKNPDFKQSWWYFECFADTSNVTEYPGQICGSMDTQEFNDRWRDELDLLTKEHTVYYDVFYPQVRITQTNHQCQEATRVFSEECNDDTRRDAITSCGQILSKRNHRKCTTKYACNPMDVFVSCLKWACSNYTDNNACEDLARGIDMCRTFRDNNLSQMVKDADCYKEFLPIDY